METALDTYVLRFSALPYTILIDLTNDRALHVLALYDSKSEPDLSPIYVIRLADMIMHLWQRYINTALVPLAGSSVTVRREMSIFNNHVVVRIEGKVNQIVQRTTDGSSFLSCSPSSLCTVY